jgi:N-acyl amino acid synthase of PEP-CTERM/exosortase system
MYREMFRHSQHAGVRYWCAAMERSLVRALNKMGFHFAQIGPQADYYGAVTPYMLDLHELLELLGDSNPRLAAWFYEKPLVFSRPARLHVVRSTDLRPNID